MIEGLKVTVPGAEVKSLLEAKAAYHTSRAADHAQTLQTLETAYRGITQEEAPKLSSSSRDPREEHRDRIKHHTDRAREDTFIANHVNVTETYLLDTNDLHRVGVLSSRY